MMLRESDVRIRDASLRVVSVAGDGPDVVFVHGWPESSAAWTDVLPLAAADGIAAHAVDLPGVGGSTRGTIEATKHELAATLGELAQQQGWRRPRLVGHDIGGMIAFAALHVAPIFEKVVVCNTAVPGVAPWDQVVGDPRIFHFSLHAVPDLPERLVHGRERAYFDWFLDTLALHPERIGDRSRAGFADAYGTVDALSCGFDWYRTLPADAEYNETTSEPLNTPLLYLRGAADRVDLETYVAGFRRAGVRDVHAERVPDCGHFPSLEAPQELWAAMRDFIA